MITPDQIKYLLHLKPHPEEGGWFVETYLIIALTRTNIKKKTKERDDA
jgi:predicted cupin superfamily sugar epimerase